MPEIAERLRESRERLGLSQQAFAEHCGIAARSQRNYESGERLPDAGYLAALVALGVDVVYVLTGEKDPAVPSLDAAEQVLIDSYRRCKPEARQHLIQTAALLSAGLAPAVGKQAAAEKSGYGQKVVGNNAIQIGSVTGKARIKNR